MAGDKGRIVEYLNWSDRGLDKYEGGQGAVGFGDLDFAVEDGSLTLHLRRGTATRRDFTIFVGDSSTRAIYEALKEHYEG